MDEALERQIDALGREQRERQRRARDRLVGAVGDAVVDLGQSGQGEHGLDGREVLGGELRGGALQHEQQGACGDR